jgi:hypothetical protein
MTIVEGAINVWPVLTQAASERRTITYKQAADVIGLKTSHLSRQLDIIYRWCLEARRPPLTMLVVTTETHLPLGDFSGVFPRVETIRDLPLAEYVRIQQRVFSRRWAADTNTFILFAQSGR